MDHTRLRFQTKRGAINKSLQIGSAELFLTCPIVACAEVYTVYNRYALGRAVHFVMVVGDANRSRSCIIIHEKTAKSYQIIL